MDSCFVSCVSCLFDFVILSCLFLAGWERADLISLLCQMFFLCFCHFSLLCSVVLDCIDS